MGSLKRKMARRRAKKQNKEFKDKVGLFTKLGDECCACQKPFDKKSKEQISTWRVVVRETEKLVRLYCPVCWETATKAVKQVMENEQKNSST